MPHKRIDIVQDDIALRCLSGCQYKVLQYLVNRADSRGICFPSTETIAQATGFNLRHVYRALQFLNDCDVMRYVRRDEYDIVTHRKLPNAYQINPEYICLAVEFVAEARAVWDTLTEKCGNRSTGLWSHINQQPTPVSQFQNQHQVSSTSRTNTNNQHAPKVNGQASHYANHPGGNEKDKNPAGETGQHTATSHQREAHDEPQGSAPRPKYANPDPIAANLPNTYYEQLASECRQIGISMPLARGFVVTYGYDRCKTALAAVQEMGQKAVNPAGLFRSIVQNGLADDFALSRQMLNNLFRQQ